MDRTFPLCENSKALSPLEILQEQYKNLQAKVLAVPLPSLMWRIQFVPGLLWFVVLIMFLLFLFFRRKIKAEMTMWC